MKGLSVVAAVVLVVLMVHPWGISAIDISPLVSCDPDCSGTSDGDKVPDPRNCTSYYFCIGQEPVDHPTSCDSGNVFDPEAGECASGTECDAICGPGGSGCPLTCNGTGSLIADAFDCSVYYYCGPAGAEDPQYCTVNLPYFDGTTCVSDSSVCCSGYCEPYCDGSGFAQVPDPLDCSNYYICSTEEGVPGDDFLFSCPDGEYFSVQDGRCESGATCTVLCDTTGGGGDGSTTTSTTTTSAGGSGCLSSLTCTAAGFFAACQDCQPEYFDCSGAGAAGVLHSCTGDTVFNPNPDYPFCVLPSNCPYSP